MNVCQRELDDLKQCRHWGSKTPGRPENVKTDGIEVTTRGPLGRGISNAVGLAAAEAHLAAKYIKPGMELIDSDAYYILGYGAMQEGISRKSCSLASYIHAHRSLEGWQMLVPPPSNCQLLVPPHSNSRE